VVVFPAPFGPTSPARDPAAISRSIPATASLVPKLLCSACTAMAGSAMTASLPACCSLGALPTQHWTSCWSRKLISYWYQGVNPRWDSGTAALGSWRNGWLTGPGRSTWRLARRCGGDCHYAAVGGSAGNADDGRAGAKD